jgi:hypothetical protein
VNAEQASGDLIHPCRHRREYLPEANQSELAVANRLKGPKTEQCIKQLPGAPLLPAIYGFARRGLRLFFLVGR